MIEKIKQLALTVKDFLLYILAPIGAILGYVFYLRGKVETLKDTLAESKAEKELAITLTEKKEAQNVANASEQDYIKLRDAYLHESGDSGTKSDPKP